MNKFFVINQQELDIVVDELISLMNNCKIFAFQGPLGAGKTTIIQRFLKKCGIKDPVVSPTFNYVHKYKNEKGQYFYHFDLYRLNSLDEFLEAGFDELLYQDNSWALIEWPEIILPLLKKDTCFVTIEYALAHKRNIILSTH